MEARFRTRMDRSLDEIAAEMHSEQYHSPFGQAYSEKAFLGAESSYQRSSNSKRYAPYPNVGSGSYSRESDEELVSRSHIPESETADDLGRPFSFSAARQIVTSSLDAAKRLFVGNLSYSTTWQNLKEHMRRAGTVRKCDVFTDSNGKSKGMGLVQYESADSAERALVELQESLLDGRRLFLRKHMDPTEREKAGFKTRQTNLAKPPSNLEATVFVQNLDYSVTWQKLKDVLKVAGKIVSVDLAKDRDGKSKGYASVQFSEQSEAINAIALFHGQMLCDRPMKLRMDSSAQYQPDPMRLRLAGLAGVTQGTQAPPLPLPLQQGLPPPTSLSLGDTLSSSSLSVPLLSAVISSLTAEKLAAILIQNNSTSGMSPQQQLLAPPMPHPPLPLIAPSTSLLGSMSPEYDHYSHTSRRGKQSHGNQARGGGIDLMDGSGANAISKRVANGEFVNVKSPQNCKVFVNNLDFSTTWHHLRNVFKTAGPVRHVEIFKHSSGKSKGCGIVIYYDPESALRAIKMFNNKNIDGRRVTVDHDRVQQSVDT